MIAILVMKGINAIAIKNPKRTIYDCDHILSLFERIAIIYGPFWLFDYNRI